MRIYREESFGGILYDDSTLSYRVVEKNQMKEGSSDLIVTTSGKRNRNDILSGPIRIYFELTRRCNLRCKHCFADSSPDEADGMPKEMIFELLTDMKRAGVINVRFTGGEPTAREDWYDILKFAKSLGLVAALSTNGIFRSDDVIERIKDISPEQLTVSIDGTEKSHDEMRGSGSFRKVVSTLEKLRDTVTNLRITTVLTRKNIGEIPEIVELANRYVKVINFVCVRPIGRAARCDDLLLSFDEHYQTAEIVKTLQAKYPDLLIMHSDLPLPEMFLKAADSKDPTLAQAGAFSNTYLSVSADGSFWPHHYSSHQIPEFRLGKFPHDSVEEVWSQSAALDGFRAWSKALRERCSECRLHRLKCAGINFELEISRWMGVIPENPYCINSVPAPSFSEYMK